ncbi:MAG TPA: MBOAT family protein, partial [Verrucomicrobiae bacterium]|nr:MBOAT family protein [Verrucomicrobiae bacterium]
MIFTSVEFLIFFLLVLLGQSLVRDYRREKTFLLVASYVFYMSWNLACGGLIFFTSTVDYYVGRGLGVIKNPTRRKWLLVASLVANLGVLAFFKYTNFLLSNAQMVMGLFGLHLSLPTLHMILPAGISFFTFQSMSYTIDVYRGELEPCLSLRDFLLFVSFFTHLIAGPIVRASRLLPQFAKRPNRTATDVETGIAYVLLGAVKKMVISDQISAHVDLIFANPAAYDAPTLLVGALGYAVQIYCDFSGYSDMAVGCARIMGYWLCENFQMPYSATNVTDFWRRWHIALSTWLRDYLYIPLGGNRHGRLNTYRNLMITMLLGGLWHGASWNFVLWGALHGSALALHRLWVEGGAANWIQQRRGLQVVWRPVSWGLTMSVVLVGWVLFRAQTFGIAIVYLSRLLGWATDGTRLSSPFILPAVCLVALVHLVMNRDSNWAETISQRAM